MTIVEALTKRIDGLLAENGITLYKLSKSSLIPKSTLENLYYGRTKSPAFLLIFKIAEGFGISVNEFIDHDLFKSKDLEIY